MQKQINTNYLAGWLIMVQVFIMVSVLQWIKNAQLYWGLLDEKDKLITALGNNADKSFYISFVYYEFISSVVVCLAMLVSFTMFFKKSRHFPMILIITVILEVAAESISVFVFGSISGYMDQLVQRLVMGVIISICIVVYLIKSERVKLTFVR